MKNLYEVGRVYVWQNQRGPYERLNGLESNPSTNPNLPKPKRIAQACTFQNESEWRCKSENGLRMSMRVKKRV